MPISFKNFLLFFLVLSLHFGCVQEELEDFPLIEPKGNVFALFEPGKTLQLQVAITGYALDRISDNDSTRVQSKLYENGELVENFNLRTQSVIQLGKSYRLECIIDQTYEVLGLLSLPSETLKIDSSEIEPLPEPLPVQNNSGTGSFILNYSQIFSIDLPINYPVEELYISRGLPANLPFYDDNLFDNGQRVAVLDPQNKLEVIVRKANANSPIRLYHINKDYFLFLEQARNPLVEPEAIPGNVSVTNMRKGVGLMAWQIAYQF